VRDYPLGAVGAAIMFLFVFAAAFADFITSISPVSTDASISLLPPGRTHWLGADFMGRDIYSRIVYGARVSLGVGLGSTLLGSACGVAVGLASGYLGGWVDLSVQRLIDMLQALPLLVLALVMAAALGPSLQTTIIAIAIPLIPSVARVIRSNTLALRELAFVEAAQAIGRGRFGIAVRHILPNTLAPLIVLATAQLGPRFLPRPRCRSSASACPSRIHPRPHAVGVCRRVRADRAMAGDISRPRHQPGGVRHQSAGRRAARHPRSAAAGLKPG
jgi:peptide/nickel transport system permease protein